jgi:oligopeptidase B
MENFACREVASWLDTEERYLHEQMSANGTLVEELLAEFLPWINQTTVVPGRTVGGWTYYKQFVPGQRFPSYYRHDSSGVSEAILAPTTEGLGENVTVSGVFLSPDSSKLAYLVEAPTSEEATLVLCQLPEGEVLATLPGVLDCGCWSTDSRSFFCVQFDADGRPSTVVRLTTDGEVSQVLVEDDPRFWMTIYPSSDGATVFMASRSSSSSEVWFVPAGMPELEPVCIRKGKTGVRYIVDRHGPSGQLLLVVTSTAGSSVEAISAGDLGTSAWQTVVPADPSVTIEDLIVFDSYLVLTERVAADSRLRIIALSPKTGRLGQTTIIESNSPGSTISPLSSYDPVPPQDHRSSVLWYSIEFPERPGVIYKQDMRSGSRELVWEDQFPPGYNPADYVTDRLWVNSGRGVQVPMTVSRRVDTPLDGSAPGVLSGYGAYGLCADEMFGPATALLLDRGFVLAVAHVRGGGELGPGWHKAGRGRNKENSFRDFLACAKELTHLGYIHPQKLAARGGSAGGLLVAVAMNAAPETFRAVIASVPFVDVLTTMFNGGDPLVVNEFSEWGDPRNEGCYHRILRWSPYDQVSAAPYPSVYITAGLNDSRVACYEPIKWAQKLRLHTTSGRPVLLDIDRNGGHAGPPDEDAAWAQEARTCAFLLSQTGQAA